MKVKNTRSGPSASFVHCAAEYDTSAEFLAITLPLIEQARRQGAPVAVIAAAPTVRLLREITGSDRELILLPPPAPELRRSGQSIATMRAREFRELTDRADSAIVIAHYDPEQSLFDPAAWAEAEAALNIAVTDLPLTIACLYRKQLKAELAAPIQWNHLQLLGRGGTVRPNPAYRPPAQVLASYPVRAPVAFGPPDSELRFNPWQLTDLRVLLQEVVTQSGLDQERAEDFVSAVNEVASNAVEHGSSVGLLQTWLRPQFLACEVHDSGSLGQPIPGLRPPRSNDPRGRGLWIARQLCDLLHVWADRQGTHVRVQVARR
ncbi:MAG: ATP-binding protein [Pseudonocardia sp.]|nr:ATP-binding protein [Pseudonocardia sp.]